MSEPWDSHQEEWRHRVGKGDLHGTTAGRTGGETTQALWNLANFTTSPRCCRWSYRMWWLPVVFALALIWLFFVMFWSQNAYLTPCLSYLKPLLLWCLPHSALPTFSCFSQRVLSHSQKKRLKHLYFFLKKARLKKYSKRFVDSSVCSSIIIFSGTLRWSLVRFYIQTNCFSSPVFAFLVSSHIIIFFGKFQ